MKTFAQFAVVALIGIVLAGCAGTGARTDVSRTNFCEPAGNTHPARPLESCGY